jgi:2-polyprenyl-3-methyl-5-hydroxy-6-metoxy-1,4-benzoquinol methylase
VKPGPFIRKLFGPYESRISAAYRSIYLDMDAFIELMQRWKPVASEILEVGCGEGAVTERLKITYPNSKITAIDITPRIGRLYRGSRCDVEFIQTDVREVAKKKPEHYDFVVLSDVLHHVPVESRQGLLDSIRALLAPKGSFIFKDWQRNHAPIHWLCYASDRFLTGDRIDYMTRQEMRRLLEASFGPDALVGEARIRPWWNNIATLVELRN